jgi:hypothetical protein
VGPAGPAAMSHQQPTQGDAAGPAIEPHAQPDQGDSSVPAAGSSTQPTAPAPASKEPQLKHVELKRHIEKLRGAIRNLRGELAETRRIQNEQNDRLLKIDMHLEHIESQYLNFV